MLDTSFDITAIVESVKAIKRFAAAPEWADYIISPFGTLAGTTDDDLTAHAREHTSTVFHPASTASMTSLTSSDGVVNPDLTVKGTSGLRVVDLSAFVSFKSTNITIAAGADLYTSHLFLVATLRVPSTCSQNVRQISSKPLLKIFHLATCYHYSGLLFPRTTYIISSP